MNQAAVTQSQRRVDWLIGAFILATLIASVWLQSRVLVNHDVGWVLNSAGRLLEGARFGSDVVAANPPLIWWLSLPAAAVSRLTVLTEVQAFRAFVWAVCLWSLWSSARLTRPLGNMGRSVEQTGILVALSFAILILPGAIFGQREHIAFALAVPYALLAARRMAGSDDFDVRQAVVIGCAAGIGFALKPHFLLVPALLSLELAIIHRSVRRAMVAESLAAGATVALYATLVVLLTPDYLNNAVPLFRSVYWGFESSDSVLLYRIAAPGIWMIVLALTFTLLTRSSSPIHLALTSVGIAFLVSYWLQRKGYEYHAYPVLASSIVLVTAAAAGAIITIAPKLRQARLPVRLSVPALIAAVWIFCMVPRVENVANWYAWANIETGPMGRARATVIDTVASLVDDPRDCVFAFSTHPSPGFPTMNYVDARWGARSNSQFAIPAIVRRRLDPGAGQPHDLTAAETYTRQAVLDDFRRCPPRVVMVNASQRKHGLGYLPYDPIAFFSEDPRFAAVWENYHEVALISGTRFYVRSEDAAVAQDSNLR